MTNNVLMAQKPECGFCAFCFQMQEIKFALANRWEKEEKNKEKFINNALLSPRLFIYFVDT